VKVGKWQRGKRERALLADLGDVPRPEGKSKAYRVRMNTTSKVYPVRVNEHPL
jgi:hypothetical protein